MALAIDGSSPATAVQSANTATVATASFTPPNGSLLLPLWSANSVSGANPAAPSITDNRGTPLTYTLGNWKSRADGSPNPNGQAAQWSAPVTSSVAQTVTVTNGATADRQAALRVIVLTGQDTTTPIGAKGEGHSTSGSTLAPSFTGTAAGSWGFLVVCDWDLTGAMTAGAGTTLIASANVGTSFTYGFFRRTTADGTVGGTTTLNVNLGGSSTNVTYCYVEVVPAAGGTTNPVSVSGGITPAGALVRQVGKPLGAGITPAGAVAKLVAKPLAGSVAPAGALAVVRAILRSFAGTLTPTGTLVRRPGKQLAGSVTPAGAATRSTSKLLGGGVTPAGALGLIRAILRSFAGSITPAGALTRRTAKALAGGIAPAGSVRRLVARTLAGTLGAVGTLLKRPGKQLAGTLNPAGAVQTGASSGPSVVHRPNTGTVGRPDSGIVTRPFTGIVERP